MRRLAAGKNIQRTLALSQARPQLQVQQLQPATELQSCELSRYRDGDRSRKAVNRFSRGRDNLIRRGDQHAASSASTSSAVTAKPEEQNNLTSNPQIQQQNQGGLFSSYSGYTPVEPLHDITDVQPPPVAPGDLLDLNHGAARILSEPSLVVVRQIEMMNVFLGFEQANRYRLVNSRGEDVGFLAEQEGGFGTSIGRQLMRGHRPFNCSVLDTEGNVVLRVTRPFSFINSRISISKGEDPPSAANKIGECQQIWSPFRRQYALFHRYRSEDANTHPTPNSDIKSLTVQEGPEPAEAYAQFANVDSRMLAWDFYLQSDKGQVLGSINRNFMGFGREVLTDTGQYVLRFDRKTADSEVQIRLEKGMGINEELSKVANENRDAKEVIKHESAEEKALVQVDEDKGLTLDQRAILLATAITVDIDYFSRHGGGMHMPMLWMPMPLPGGGGGAPAEVPPTAEGIPGEAGPTGPDGSGQAPTASSTSPEDMPYASPEYGESPGMQDFDAGFGSSGGGYDNFPSGQPDDVMQDPWASGSSSSGDGESGGGFWGFIQDASSWGSDS